MNRRRNRQHRRSRKQTSENKAKPQAASSKSAEKPAQDSLPVESSPGDSQALETAEAPEAASPGESKKELESQANSPDASSEPAEAAQEDHAQEVQADEAPVQAAEAQTDSHTAKSPLTSTGPLIDENTVYTGDVLREYREHKGITLRSISNTTRIGVPSLMAVEEERYEDLPNARIYVLGFVRCLAQEIGLDREVAAQSYISRWQSWWDLRSEEDRRSYR